MIRWHSSQLEFASRLFVLHEQKVQSTPVVVVDHCLMGGRGGFPGAVVTSVL